MWHIGEEPKTPKVLEAIIVLAIIRHLTVWKTMELKRKEKSWQEEPGETEVQR